MHVEIITNYLKHYCFVCMEYAVLGESHGKYSIQFCIIVAIFAISCYIQTSGSASSITKSYLQFVKIKNLTKK